MISFDVFMSYSRADQDAVEQLGRALRASGLTVFVDGWYLVADQFVARGLGKAPARPPRPSLSALVHPE